MARILAGDTVRLDVSFLPVMEGVVVEVRPGKGGKESLDIYIVEFDGEVRLEMNAGQIRVVRKAPDASTTPPE